MFAPIAKLIGNRREKKVKYETVFVGLECYIIDSYTILQGRKYNDQQFYATG